MSGQWIFNFVFAAGLAGGVYGSAVLLHEAGHALAGYLFRAKCLWIRVGGMLWVPGAGVFFRAVRTVRPGECALSCPDKKSCVAAALGGAAMNFVTGVAAGFCCMLRKDSLLVDSSGSAGWLFFSAAAAFCVCSLLMSVFSLCMAVAGKGNDGMLIKRLCREQGFCQKFRQGQQRDLLRLEFGLVDEMF